MIKKGSNYLGSKEQRHFDLAVCYGASSLVSAIGAMVRTYVALDKRPLSPINNEFRVGLGGSTFLLHKYATLDPDTGKPLNPVADILLNTGLDKLAQLRSVREKNMSIVGWQALPPEDYAAFRSVLPASVREQHDRVVRLSRPGIVSSYGIHAYTRNHVVNEFDPAVAEEWAEMNIKDARDASLFNNIRLVAHRLNEAAVSRIAQE